MFPITQIAQSRERPVNAKDGRCPEVHGGASVACGFFPGEAVARRLEAVHRLRKVSYLLSTSYARSY